MVATWDQRTQAEHDRLRSALLQRWLPAVASYSPYWGERFGRASLDPAAVSSLAELRKLPPIREADIAGAGGVGSPALLMRPKEDEVKAMAAGNVILEIARGIRRAGMEGKRLTLLQEYKPIHLHRGGRDDELAIGYSRSDLDRLHRAGARSASVLGLGDTDYMISAVPASAALDYWGIYHLALGSSMLALHPRSVGEHVDRVVEAFALVPTTVVAVPVDEAVELAAVLVESGAQLARVRTVLTVGTPPTSDERIRIRDAWRAAGASEAVRVLAAWAPPEARALWAECPAGVADDGSSTGLHLFPDLQVVELLDPTTGRSVEADGDLTYTSAGWHGTALVRYQTGDYVERLTTQPCPGCQRTVPRLVGEVVPAAWQPAVLSDGEYYRADLRGGAIVLQSTPGVDLWRIEVAAPPARKKTERVIVQVAGALGDDARQELASSLEIGLGVAPTSVDVVAHEALEMTIDEVGGVFADTR